MENKPTQRLTFENLPDAMEKVLNSVSKLELKLEVLTKNFEPPQQDNLLTQADVAKKFKVHITTVQNWTKKGKLKKYGIGNRIYFKSDEVEASIKKI